MASSAPPRSAGMPVRAVAYLRVSQARDGIISPQLQLRAVEEHCQRRGYALVRTVEDVDRSGRFWKRRQVEQAVAMIERGEADVLVVWRWSRVTRNRLDWALAVERVETAGGRLESATEAFDTDTSGGRLARGILAELAAFESDRVGDIWREVHGQRVARGLLPVGQPMFGYRKVDGRYVRDRRTARVLADLYRRYVAGESLNSLLRWINRQSLRSAPPKRTDCDWSFSTLTRVLDSGFAAGYIRVRGELVPGAHKPIISEDLWRAYLARRAATSVRRPPAPDDVLLAGMVWCGCGSRMLIIRESRPRRPGYRCASHPAGRPGAYMAHRPADALVTSWLAALVAAPATRTAGEADFRAYLARRSQQAAAIRRRLAAAGPAEREALQATLGALRTVMPEPARLARALLEDWDVLGVPQRRARLATLTHRVVLHNELAQPYLVLDTAWGSRMSFGAADGPAAEVRAALVRGEDRPATETATPPGTGPVLLTPAEAARLARVQAQTLRHWDVHGRLPHTESAPGRDGRLYDLEDLRALQPPRRLAGEARPARGQRAPTAGTPAAIRAWGRSRDLAVSETGRLPQPVVRAYWEDHPGPPVASERSGAAPDAPRPSGRSSGGRVRGPEQPGAQARGSAAPGS